MNYEDRLKEKIDKEFVGNRENILLFEIAVSLEAIASRLAEISAALSSKEANKK